MSLSFYSHTAPARESDLLKLEYDPQFCREDYTLSAGDGAERVVLLGTPLAYALAAGSVSATAAAVAGGTGDGTIALADPATTSAVVEGTYVITCTTGGADGTSKFRVEGPNGKSIGTATGGAAFAKQIKFTISGGAAAFVEGDAFEVIVVIDQEADANERVAWEPGGRIVGLSLRNTTAPDGVTATGLSLDNGPAIVSASAIQWPDGITATEKAQAVEMIKSLGIKIR